MPLSYLLACNRPDISCNSRQDWTERGMTENSNYFGWNIPGCSFSSKIQMCGFPNTLTTNICPFTRAFTHTNTHTQLHSPSAQVLFSLFPVSHPTTLRSFLSLLAAWNKIQNTRRDGCKLASVNSLSLSLSSLSSLSLSLSLSLPLSLSLSLSLSLTKFALHILQHCSN